jgi:hypothetical protein
MYINPGITSFRPGARSKVSPVSLLLLISFKKFMVCFRKKIMDSGAWVRGFCTGARRLEVAPLVRPRVLGQWHLSTREDPRGMSTVLIHSPIFFFFCFFQNCKEVVFSMEVSANVAEISRGKLTWINKGSRPADKSCEHCGKSDVQN